MDIPENAEMDYMKIKNDHYRNEDIWTEANIESAKTYLVIPTL